MNKKILLVCIPFFLTSCAEVNTVLDSVNKTIKEVSAPKSQSVSARKICNDFMDNEIVGKKNWKGAYVSINGKIDSIYQDEWGDKNINLNIDRKTKVLATLQKSQNVDKLKSGNKINITGRVSNVMHTGSCNILLDNASF